MSSPGNLELRDEGLRPESSSSLPARTLATRRILSMAMIREHPPMSSSVRMGRRSSALTASCVSALAPQRDSFRGCISPAHTTEQDAPTRVYKTCLSKTLNKTWLWQSRLASVRQSLPLQQNYLLHNSASAWVCKTAERWQRPS